MRMLLTAPITCLKTGCHFGRQATRLIKTIQSNWKNRALLTPKMTMRSRYEAPAHHRIAISNLILAWIGLPTELVAFLWSSND